MTQEADVKIDKAMDIDEVKDSPLALGACVGIGEPFPYRLRMPVRGRPRSDWPIAVFWLHPFDLSVAAELAELGINPDPNLDDLAEIARQNRALSQIIVDKGRGWENLIREDGSEWKYNACSKDENGTDADPRVKLSQQGAYFALLKGRSLSAAFTVASQIEGNSESSSEASTGEKDERNARRIDSPPS